MSGAKRHCGRHAYIRHGYVCGHLFAQRRGDTGVLVYYRADPVTDVDDDEPDSVGDFWCRACDQVLQREGEWNDVSEAYADIHRVCEFCLVELLDRNVEGEVAPGVPD